VNLTLSDDERDISNRHPCRLETTLNPFAPTTAPSLIVTGTGVQNALDTLDSSVPASSTVGAFSLRDFLLSLEHCKAGRCLTF
jgi:hypothetical protein